LQRVNLVYFRRSVSIFTLHKTHLSLFAEVNNDFSTELSPKLMNASILSRFQKRFYPMYAHKRTTDIWTSREALLQYEEALEMQSKVDELMGYVVVKPALDTTRSISVQQGASSSKLQGQNISEYDRVHVLLSC
jgi:fanconi-associated nuclease 1